MGHLKLCDFGFARQLPSKEVSITDYVSTRSTNLTATSSEQSRSDFSQPVCRLAACRLTPASSLMLRQTGEGARHAIVMQLF